MNYDQPRQLADGTGWHYTSMNDGRVHPVGYCGEHPAHETEDDARRCYRDYELNERLRLDGTIGHWNPCQHDGCETLTNRQAMVMPWGPSWLLCDEHRTREVAAGLYGEKAGGLGALMIAEPRTFELPRVRDEGRVMPAWLAETFARVERDWSALPHRARPVLTAAPNSISRPR